MKPFARLGWAALVLATALLSGCGKDKPATVVAPRPTTLPTLSRSWPADDHRWWKYDLVLMSFADTLTYYPSEDQVPPIGTMPDLYAGLNGLPIGTVDLADTSTFQLTFDGNAFAGGGDYGQKLTETLTAAPAPGPTFGASGPVRNALLEAIAAARPDLRLKLAARGLAPFDNVFSPVPPTFLRGGVWQISVDAIGTFSDLDPGLGWIFLTSALTTGSEFTLQLVPSLTDDVFLHGRILGMQTMSTPAGNFVEVLMCFYVLDTGVQEVFDSQAQSLGFVRLIDYAIVGYAQGVGPIYCYERHQVENRPGYSHGARQQTLRLTANGLNLTP
jgi:hypothetical protein